MKKPMHWTGLLVAAGIFTTAAGSAYAYPEFEPRGRLHLDAAVHDEDEIDLDDGFLNRRARMGIGGRLDALWDFRIEYDFSEEGVSAADLRLRRSLQHGRITIGQTKVPMGLNQLTSSNNMTFIERSSISNIVPDSRRMGLRYDLSTDLVTFQTMGYGRAIGDQENGDMPLGIAARLVFNPAIGGNHMLHLGASAAYEDRQDYNSLSFSDRPEARPAGVRLINTGTLDDVDSTTKYGLEFAYQNGPFSLESEYMAVTVDRSDNDDPTFDGFHVQASYVLTGESRSYGGGDFGGIRPASSAGAWEIAARYSHMDLNDSGIQGGEQSNVTLALNYYASRNIRFMANAIFVDVKDSMAEVNGVVVDDESPNIFLVRGQYNF